MKEIDEAFKQTTKILLGAELEEFENYSEWLFEHVPRPIKTKSSLSGKEVYVAPPRCFAKTGFDPKKAIDLDEMEQIKPIAKTLQDFDGLSYKAIACKYSAPIAVYCGNYRYSPFQNIEKSSGAGKGMNILNCEDVYLDVKYIANSYYVNYSERIFGCVSLTFSKYCINCYNSTNLTRCFEMDGCTNCSDSYFCHNSEALSNCLFCFNAKSLRYAIGNIIFAKEEYMRLKSIILGEISSKLENSKKLDLNIYNLGCK